jgi:hypothetical protein
MAMSSATERPSSRPCGKAVLAVFGLLFLIALLAVPVVTTTSTLRQDPGSLIVFKMTYPRNSTMFLPSYLARKGHPAGGGVVRLRAAQWVGTMAVVALLGVLDSLAICRLFRRRAARRPPEKDPADTDSETARGRSGLDLFS